MSRFVMRPFQLPSALEHGTPGSLRCVTEADVSETFLSITGSIDYPILIVTCADGERRAGCVVGFATQTSFDPPRFLACISRANRTFRLATEVDALAVHLVPRAQADLVELFGGQTGDDVDKFARCAWTAGPRGVPLLDACPSWFAGEVCERHDLGDHVGHLLAPFAAHHEDGDWISVHEVRHIEPGHPA
jgi:flavin reductase (DIM6/NTAB) family NADH-FMN oxidoreductase RutF